MAKYGMYNRQAPPKKRPWKIHPVWQGIGCLLMILIPIMSYAGSVLLVQANFEQHWLPIPRDLVQTVTLPVVGPVPNLYANLMVTVILMLLGFGVLTIFFGIFYSVIGPPKLGPMDAPPMRRSARRRR